MQHNHKIICSMSISLILMTFPPSLSPSLSLSPSVNFLIIECLERYYFFYGNDLKVECPTGSGNEMNLLEVSQEICHRVCSIFIPDENGKR